MLTIYESNEANKWNKEIMSYDKWDVYYLYEYAYSLEVHGDGQPLLISYSDAECKLCIVVMKQDIHNCKSFSNLIPECELYDLETPYGYGGILTNAGEISEETQRRFASELKEYCLCNNIVSLFIRFDSLVFNYNVLPHAIDCRYLRDTITIDTSDKNLIVKNMDPKCRNMFRKAEKSGVVIKKDSISSYKAFMDIYELTMDENLADKYYYFSEDYYIALAEMNGNACIYYAYMNEKPISAAIILYNNRNMHYHLSGTLQEYRKYSPGNLLLYKVACDGCDMGIKRFHLGGGMSANDSLFGFKKQFNRSGRMPFNIGRMIFNEEAYDRLLNIRTNNDPLFNINNNRMIQYRG